MDFINGLSKAREESVALCDMCIHPSCVRLKQVGLEEKHRHTGRMKYKGQMKNKAFLGVSVLVR